MVKFRIAVIDDFLNTYCFIDYKDYGSLQVWGASCVGSARPSFTAPTDSIAVFFNFDLVGGYKKRSDAAATIRRLLEQAPVDLTQFAATVFAWI
jgi:hypothetical protein